MSQSHACSVPRFGLAALLVTLSGLQFAPPVLAAGVFYELNDGTGITHVTDPSLVSVTTADTQATADLQAGTLRARVTAAGVPGQTNVSVYRSAEAGITDVQLLNALGVPVVLRAGDLMLDVDGLFAFSSSTPGYASVNVSLSLTAYLTPLVGQTRVSNANVSVFHDASQSATGPLVYSSTAPSINVLGGATAQLLSNSPTAGLQAILQAPAFTLNPGDRLSVAAQVLVTAQAFGGTVASNDLFNTASLHLVLPRGTTLQSNASVPLDWANPVPLPGAG